MIFHQKLYIIDLARSKSYHDREQDLLNTIKDLKTKLVIFLYMHQIKN